MAEGGDLVSGMEKKGSRGAQEVAPGSPSTSSASAASARSDGRDVGRALRTVYDRALEESIPKEMLDLLGKLD